MCFCWTNFVNRQCGHLRQFGYPRHNTYHEAEERGLHDPWQGLPCDQDTFLQSRTEGPQARYDLLIHCAARPGVGLNPPQLARWFLLSLPRRNSGEEFEFVETAAVHGHVT